MSKAMSEQEVVAQVQALMKGEASIEVDITAPEVKPIIEDIHKARVRLALSSAGIVVDFPQAGKTGLKISLFDSVGRRSSASATPVAAPQGKSVV